MNQDQNEPAEPTEGKERFKRFAAEAAYHNTLRQCRIVSDAAAETMKDDLRYFCEKIEVATTSLVFNTAVKIGDRAHEWEGENLSWEWLIAYVFAIAEPDEFEQMMKVAEATRAGTFNQDMHLLIELAQNWHPKSVELGANLTEHFE